MDETTARRPCPYCAEDIAAAAIRCPHCRTRLSLFEPNEWRRDHPGGRVAGVAAAIAHATAVPVSMVRLGFGVLTFIHLLGPLLYGLGWIFIPRHAGAPSIAEQTLADAEGALRRWRRADVDHDGHLPWKRPA
jgi:phage shock protein PspC (stress-responsive transcriptional regulator)